RLVERRRVDRRLVGVVRQQVLAGAVGAGEQRVVLVEEVVLLARRVVLLVVELLDGLLVVGVDARRLELLVVLAAGRNVVGLGERLGLGRALDGVEQARARVVGGLVGGGVVGRMLALLLAVRAD